MPKPASQTRLDPEPRSRAVFAFHRPESLAAWLEPDSAIGAKPNSTEARLQRPAYHAPATFLSRLQHMPPLEEHGLWPAQIKAIIFGKVKAHAEHIVDIVRKESAMATIREEGHV